MTKPSNPLVGIVGRDDIPSYVIRKQLRVLYASIVEPITRNQQNARSPISLSSEKVLFCSFRLNAFYSQFQLVHTSDDPAPCFSFANSQ